MDKPTKKTRRSGRLTVNIPHAVINSPLLAELKPYALAVWVKLVRYIWRQSTDPERNELARYFRAGLLATSIGQERIARELGMGRSKTNAAVRELLDTGFILWAEERQLHGGRGLVYVLGHHPTLRAFEDEILCAERSVAEYEKLRTNSPNLHRSDLLAQHAEVMAKLAADVRLQYSSRLEDEHLLCAVTSAAVAEVDTEESTRGVSVGEDTNQNREASPPTRSDDDPGEGLDREISEMDPEARQSLGIPARVRQEPDDEQGPADRGAIESVRKVFESAWAEKFPGLDCLAFQSKEVGLVRHAIRKYGVEDTIAAVDYTVRYWDDIVARHLGRLTGYPGLGLIASRWGDTLVAEATTGHSRPRSPRALQRSQPTVSKSPSIGWGDDDE